VNQIHQVPLSARLSAFFKLATYQLHWTVIDETCA